MSGGVESVLKACELGQKIDWRSLLPLPADASWCIFKKGGNKRETPGSVLRVHAIHTETGGQCSDCVWAVGTGDFVHHCLEG